VYAPQIGVRNIATDLLARTARDRTLVGGGDRTGDTLVAMMKTAVVLVAFVTGCQYLPHYQRQIPKDRQLRLDDIDELHTQIDLAIAKDDW
jgi:hypothetical protein